MLFVPGNSNKLQEKAAKTKADALILDLEDSVLNRFKEEARKIIASNVRKGLFSSHLTFIRLNDRHSGLLINDLQALMIDGVTGFLFPKVEDEQDIVFFDRLLSTMEIEKGFDPGFFKIIPLIETAGAVIRLDKICSSSERNIAVAFGSEDFIASIHGIHDKAGRSLYVPRAMIVMAARANGILPIDTLHIDVHDLEDLEDNLRLAKNLGFDGTLLLHPKEIELAHQYFSPSEEEVLSARNLFKMSEKADESGKKVAYLDGKLVGPPMLLSAKQILDKHELIKKLGK
jgi:citrate lyase subunit beta/citryl-CoA lyase